MNKNDGSTLHHIILIFEIAYFYSMQSLHTIFPFPPPRYKYNDYKNWDEEWELIDGYAYSLLPSATFKHQQLATQFICLIGNLFENKSLNCSMYSRLDWIVNEDNVVRPDGMIVSRKFTTDWLTFPPVLILEITSVHTDFKDRNVKYKLYEMHGVKYYLVADTENRKIDYFELIEGTYQTKTDRAFDVYKDCKIVIDFEEMWKQ